MIESHTYTHPLVNAKGLIPRFFINKREIDVNIRSPETHEVIRTERRTVEEEYVEIRIAGDDKTVMVRRVQDRDREQFADYYRAFKMGVSGPIGTPLEDWPMLNADQINFLKAKNISTLEALAELGENGIASLGMGGRALVESAKRELQRRRHKAEEAEAEELRRQVQALQEKLAQLEKLATGGERRGPGRPPKAEVEAA